MKESKKFKGFTLMELMVVVALVLLVITAGLTNYITQVKRSRDARRKSDLEQIRAALEMYRTDNQEYPDMGWLIIDGSDSLTSILTTGGYMSSVPVDPKHTGGNPGPCSNPERNRYNYRSLDSGGRYILTAIMEKTESKNSSPCANLPNWPDNGWCPGTNPGDFGTYDYCYGVQNP